MTSTEIPLAPAWQPPHANGEVVFEAPWQGRVFGMAVMLAQQGTIDWSEFQNMLIEVVGEWDLESGVERAVIGPSDTAKMGQDYPYFELFAEALSRLVVGKGLVAEDDLVAADAEIKARPHGHDH